MATNAATINVQWLHDSLVPLITALTEQEYLSVDAFTGMLSFTDAPEKEVKFGMPPRPEIPILDLAYIPPVAAIEATTPLKVLTAMFAGDDSGIIAAAESWSSAGRRMLQAAESLRSAAALIAGTTEGSAFSIVEQAISTIANQCDTVATNSAAMAASMLELPPIRVAAHAQLIAMEAEIAAEATAAGAATGGAGAAAVAAKSQAQVAAFVSGFLQPALDTARPLVTNLSVPVVNHTGGGALTSGGAATLAANETITQVAGGAAAPGAGQVAGQPAPATPQVGQVGTTPAGAAQAAPVSHAPAAPSGGPGYAPGGAPASPVSMPAGRPTPANILQGRSLPDRRTAGPGAGTTPTTRYTPGGVAQPLLPRGMNTATPGKLMSGTINGTTAHHGAGSSSSQNGAGARGAAPGMSGAAPASGSGQGGQAHRGAGAGAAPMNASGQKPAANGQGRGASANSLFGGGQGRRPGLRGRGKGSGSSLLESYFRRQFLGEKSTTVKKVIR
ncbi:hypothetical protein PQI66_01525 [Corynebacterium sp. USCH3]|uniref:hypothetical protein n=1 Tax=Corynebacterium sp. USCH3 TaxID=3024840 RepID=UPI0030B79C95